MATKTKNRESLLDDEGFYKTRRHQCIALAQQVERGKTKLADALREAAMIGACEERDWALSLIRESCLSDQDKQALVNAITTKSVLSLLGY